MPAANERVQPILDDLVSRDVERGLQVAAYLNGELVLDAWAGLASASSNRRVDAETMFVGFSCGKGVLATIVHMLADRRRLDYDETVASYWPEFGTNGKAGITVRHMLAHTAGIPQLPPGSTIADLCDWDGMCARIADLAPVWEPGSRTGYHARTFGYVLGELVRRVDGRPVSQYLQEELCRPLGIDALYFGVPPELEPRLADLEDGPPPADPSELPAGPFLSLVFPPNLPATAAVMNRPEVRRACIPSSSGVMDARSLARHYAMLACGGELDGKRLLSSERISRASALQTDDVDQVLGWPLSKALGYFVGAEWSPMGTRRTAFGHPGSGGSIGFADPEHRFAFALLKTRVLSGQPPGTDAAYVLANATRAALGISAD